MGCTVCNFIVSQLLFDLFVRVPLSPIIFLFLIGNVVSKTPHRTEVRFQNEENAPVVPPNKKFLFSKMKASKFGTIDTATRPLNLWQIKGCDKTTRGFLGYLYNLRQRAVWWWVWRQLPRTYGFWRIHDVTKRGFSHKWSACLQV